MLYLSYISIKLEKIPIPKPPTKNRYRWMGVGMEENSQQTTQITYSEAQTSHVSPIHSEVPISFLIPTDKHEQTAKYY